MVNPKILLRCSPSTVKLQQFPAQELTPSQTRKDQTMADRRLD